MKITRAVVPSLFTILNMFCGFLSITKSSEKEFAMACWFIIAASIFDSLDGAMARLTKTSSEFGVQIDSLSDIVSFGVAPAFLVYQLSLFQFEVSGVIISSLLMVMGGIRLARFNVQLVGFDKDYFTGLAIPLGALFIITFILNFLEGNILNPTAEKFLIPLVIMTSLLMVSKVRYETLPKFTRSDIRKHPLKIIGFLAGITIIIFTKGSGAFYILLFVILTGLVRHLIVMYKNQQFENKPEEDISSLDI
ncbi:MAG: CDP-diacylglycerol--serine O-phosphatidyltransferase [Ignavibacteria bacterium]|nr:CDP-diacylglycerol--serine O-phosphatidyltransferase [Bacteroidota bacterium]MSQ46358.1 CDP-diacylglycerol--serine O-phosphatidyltransferase [Ignavibacteria bacterium]